RRCVWMGMTRGRGGGADALGDGAHVKVVATGGLAERMRGISRCIDVVDSDLTIHGLRIIWRTQSGSLAISAPEPRWPPLRAITRSRAYSSAQRLGSQRRRPLQ